MMSPPSCDIIIKIISNHYNNSSMSWPGCLYPRLQLGKYLPAWSEPSLYISPVQLQPRGSGGGGGLCNTSYAAYTSQSPPRVNSTCLHPADQGDAKWIDNISSSFAFSFEDERIEEENKIKDDTKNLDFVFSLTLQSCLSETWVWGRVGAVILSKHQAVRQSQALICPPPPPRPSKGRHSNL